MTSRPPAVSWILLCDTAIVDLDGRVSAIGITDRLFVRTLPARLARLTLVARFDAAEFDPDWLVRVVVTPPTGATLTFEDPEDADISLEHCIARLEQLPVDAPGAYRVDLVIDGSVVGTTTFDVGLTTPTARSAAGRDEDIEAMD